MKKNRGRGDWGDVLTTPKLNYIDEAHKSLADYYSAIRNLEKNFTSSNFRKERNYKTIKNLQK